MKFQILSPEIGHKNAKMCHDYWVRKDIEKAALEMGYDVLPVDTKTVPDIQFVMWGMKPRYKVRVRGKMRVLWLCSRPYHLPRMKYLSSFDRVYTLTRAQQKSLRDRRAIQTSVLPIATSKSYIPATKPYKYNVVYMGTHKQYRASTIMQVANMGKTVGIAGCNWEKVRHKNITWHGRFWPNDQLGVFYNLAPIAIHPTDLRYTTRGIVPIRIVDVYASSDCLCITNDSPGLKETFIVTPPTYNSSEELTNLINHYLCNESDRCSRQRAVREGVCRTYKHLLRDVVKDYENLLF